MKIYGRCCKCLQIKRLTYKDSRGSVCDKCCKIKSSKLISYQHNMNQMICEEQNNSWDNIVKTLEER